MTGPSGERPSSDPRTWERFDLVAEWFLAVPADHVVTWKDLSLVHGPWHFSWAELYLPGVCEVAGFWWMWTVTSTADPVPATSDATVRFEALLPWAHEPRPAPEWVLELTPDMSVWTLWQEGRLLFEQQDPPSVSGLDAVPADVFADGRGSGEDLVWKQQAVMSDDCVSAAIAAWVAEFVGRSHLRFAPGSVESISFFQMLNKARNETGPSWTFVRFDDGGSVLVPVTEEATVRTMMPEEVYALAAEHDWIAFRNVRVELADGRAVYVSEDEAPPSRSSISPTSTPSPPITDTGSSTHQSTRRDIQPAPLRRR